MSGSWQFWVDRGGTFTDVIALTPERRLQVRKVLSAARDGTDPGLVAIRALLGEAPRSHARVHTLKLGTTVATNALLERAGEPVLLVTTAGFGDALTIGDQSRPDLFALHIVRPARLHTAVIEADERIDAAGAVLTALDSQPLRLQLESARARGFKAVAVVLLHAWRFPQHERLAGQIAREAGFETVSLSHEVSALARFVPRGETTVLDAYLSAPLARYVSGLARELAAIDPGARLEIMQSHGGLTTAAGLRASQSLLSGPAGGLIGAAQAAARLNIAELVSFDMGGTSTDVAVYDRELPQRFEHDIGGVRVQTAMLDVHTIAAGGGSVLRSADGRLNVGPQSAGADPGPACYGRGGPPTLTDVQVLLGRLRADTLPQVFGPSGASAIDTTAVTRRFEELTRLLAAETGDVSDPQTIAASALGIAVDAMANAIRRVCLRRGLDPQDFTLFCFGGAAGQHACRVARAAGMRRILVHPLASVLSAFGVGVAEQAAIRRASLRAGLDEAGLAAADVLLAQLEADARTSLEAAEPGVERRIVRLLELRAGESEGTLSIPYAPLARALAAFASMHEQRYGFAAPSSGIVIESVRIEARTEPVDAGALQAEFAPLSAELPLQTRAWFGEWLTVPLVQAAALSGSLAGPALIVEPNSTFALEPGWRAAKLPSGEILVTAERDDGAAATERLAGAARTEIFNGLFMHIATEMGEVLKRTAQSVNIKERLDYSCALFDAQGRLIANAPHMPVHLGSMGASVRAVIAAHAGRMRAGDAWLINSPYAGGTHLPDMTVVSPVFLASEPQSAAFFVASRAHHADIGGITPGSMPAFSRRIEEEGALFEDFQLVAAGRLRERELLAGLAHGPWPARNPRQNLADLAAQLAANARGAEELMRAVQRYGAAGVREGMQRVRANAALCVRQALAHLAPGSFRYEMDGGEFVQVRIDVDHVARRARIDFSGSSAQGDHNFNAPRSVSIAAVLYVFRTLVERPIPLNEGCLEPLEIVIPPGSMLDPAAPAAVAAGNVETSQCLVDALLGALGKLAGSQGTMNNLSFGDASLQYYETIAGGSGAGPGFEGADAVQTHMTNSRLTDPEILEAALPVLVREFSIRRGSGGRGAHRGGDGAIRRLLFRAPFSGSLLANRRRVPPFGLAGGEHGAAGAGYIVRTDGTRTVLAATARFDLAPGDELVILTPGGGGFGAPGA